MKNKKAKSIIISSLIFLVVSFLALSPFFVFASPDDPVIDGMVTVSNNGVTISAKEVEHCMYKPDGENDGYKICEAIIEGSNLNNYSLTADIFKFELDKAVEVKGQVYEYYFSNQSELYTETIYNLTEIESVGPDGNPMIQLVDTSRNVTRRRFTNWILMANPTGFMSYNNENFAYKVKFEFPQYMSASYNFTVSYKKLPDNTEIDIILDPDITACGTLGTEGAVYTQTANIVDNGLSAPCIWITAENVTYSGKGYTIRSTNNEPGIYTEQFNTTIQHTDVSMGGSAQGYGIWLASGSHNSTAYNNTLSDQYFGVMSSASHYNNITRNTIDSNTVGIYLTNSDSNNITDNVMGTGGGYGFYVVLGSTYNSISNNTIDSYNYGIFIYTDAITSHYNSLYVNDISNIVYWGVALSSNYNLVENNNITSGERGIFTGVGDYNNLTGNILSNHSPYDSGSKYGIVFESGSSYNIIENNSITANDQALVLSQGVYSNVTNNTINFGTHGIFITDTNRSIWINNKVNNQTDNSFSITSGSLYNIIINATTYIYSDSASNGAIRIDGVSSHNIFQDSSFTTNQTKFISVIGSSLNNTFLNSTYSAVEVVTAGSQLIRKRYFDAQVNYTHNSTAVPNANITAFNTSGSAQFSVLSGATGAIAQQSLIEYINTSTNTYYNNYTINATLTGWNTNSPTSHVLNITANTLQQFNVADSVLPSTTIVDPKEQTYATNDSLALNHITTDAGRGIDSCWYKIINSTSDLLVDNVTIPGCANITFNITQGAGTYNLTLYANDSANNLNSDEVEFAISLTGPAVVLDAPTDNSYLNNGTNVYFNMTPTDPDGISTCQLWGNWTGTWHKNYTWVSLTNATMNYTTRNISESSFIWNTLCNDTADNGAWALNNYTSTVDETDPNVTITTTNATSVVGLTITIDYNISDTHLKDCYFSLRTSGGAFHNYIENTSLVCTTTSRSISALIHGTFVFQLWGEDEAGNLNYANLTFITTSTGGGGGGGGGGIPVAEVTEERTFCGDGTCQIPNDYGINEDYWNCGSDCPGFDFDALMFAFTKYCWDSDNSTICFWSQMLFATVPGVEEGSNVTTMKDGQVCFQGVCERFSGKTIFTNCLDGDPLSPCFFNANLGFLVLFGTGIGLFSLTFIKVKSPGAKGRINPYQYVYIKTKKFGRRRRR